MKLAIVCFKYGVSLEDPCCYPLGFMYISAVLKRSGHDVTVFNENLHPFNVNNLNGFDAVLMTGFEEFKPRIAQTATWCKTNGIKTILGGALATFCAEEMLHHVDTVVIGGGEDVIEHALNSFGIVKGTKPDIDKLPLPDYEGFGINEYHQRHGLRYMGILTSRGCPWNCSFCAHTCQYQARSIDSVFDEIDLYQRNHKLDVVVFNDNTLNVSKGRFLQICAGMRSRGLPWTAAIRLDRLDEEMAIAAKSGGAKYFVVGVESFNQQKLDSMGKKITVEQINQGLDLLHKHNINYHGNVLVGFSGETIDQIEADVSSIPNGYRIFPAIVQPFIGTHSVKRAITKLQELRLSAKFKKIIEDSGMYQYPELT